MNEAWFFDTLLPLLAFVGIFVVPVTAFIWLEVARRIRPRRERQSG